MKNYRQKGDTLTLIAPYAVLSGGGVKVGAYFGVAVADAPITTEVEALRKGVFELAKPPAEVWAVGVKVYWDDTAKLVTTTVATNLLIGATVLAAANPSPIGTVLLDGTIR
jgi:predicted RecA/RadA family phage recombinase